MTARIFKPAKNAMQSGTAKTGNGNSTTSPSSRA